MTHNKQQDRENIIFRDDNLIDLINRLRMEDGKNIWICGGASIAKQLINADAIDQFCISIIPTILGDGISLFEGINNQINLKLVKTEIYNGIVDLVYERR